MPAVGWPGGFATIGRGRYATRPGSRRWVIANHLLVEKVQTRAQMLHQWDQRSCTDARQIGRVRAGSDRRLGKIRRRNTNRSPPSVRQRDYDVGGTAARPLFQHLKPMPEQKMMRLGDDVSQQGPEIGDHNARELAAKTALLLASYQSRVSEDWMVGTAGIEPVTHTLSRQPVR